MKRILIALFIPGMAFATPPSAENVAKLKASIVELQNIQKECESDALAEEQERVADPKVLADLVITLKAQNLAVECSHLDQMLADYIGKEAELCKATEGSDLIKVEKVLSQGRKELILSAARSILESFTNFMELVEGANGPKLKQLISNLAKAVNNNHDILVKLDT